MTMMMMMNHGDDDDSGDDDNVFSGEASDKAKRPDVQAAVVS